MKLTLGQAAQFMGATGDFDPRAVARGYSIDSRTLKPGDLFLAVRGERTDGHEYAAAAIEQGAVAVAVAKSELGRYDQDLRLRQRRLVVDDTLAALQALGAAVRRPWWP
jgi:UDP-N-acetylmuramoyl-tripeptide--D-alanyl-D-alanine ligase